MNILIMQYTNNSIVLKISKIISDFFNPIISLVIYFIYFSTKNYDAKQSARVFLPIFIIMILPIVIWIAWNVKKGYYSNMDVSNRNQRKSLYFFIASVVTLYLLYDYVKNNSIDWLILFLMVLIILMQLSNYFIKSSMHTALNIYVSALFFSQSISVGFIWLGISLLVGITRIILKRHTIKEVLMGSLLSALVSVTYLYKISVL